MGLYDPPDADENPTMEIVGTTVRDGYLLELATMLRTARSDTTAERLADAILAALLRLQANRGGAHRPQANVGPAHALADEGGQHIDGVAVPEHEPAVHGGLQRVEAIEQEPAARAASNCSATSAALASSW